MKSISRLLVLPSLSACHLRKLPFVCALVLIDTPLQPQIVWPNNVLWLGAPYWVPPKGTLLCGVLGGRGQKWDSSCLCFLTLWHSENILMELSRIASEYRNVQGCHLAFGRAMLGLA